MMTGNLILAAFAALLSIAGAAYGAEISAKCDGVRVYAPDAMLCTNRVSVTFTSAGPGAVYAARISSPPAACSDVSFIIYNDRPAFRRDRPASIAQTYRLRPGQSQTVSIGSGFAPGERRIEIGAVRYDGACMGRSAMAWQAHVLILPVAS